jgi:hypothetical protein
MKNMAWEENVSLIKGFNFCLKYSINTYILKGDAANFKIDHFSKCTVDF